MRKKRFTFVSLLLAFFICTANAVEKSTGLSLTQRKAITTVRGMISDVNYKYDYYVSKELVMWKDGERQLVFIDEMPRAGCSIDAKAMKCGVYQINLVESRKITESRKFVKK